jgi:hypothetical protein
MPKIGFPRTADLVQHFRQNITILRTTLCPRQEAALRQV